MTSIQLLKFNIPQELNEKNVTKFKTKNVQIFIPLGNKPIKINQKKSNRVRPTRILNLDEILFRAHVKAIPLAINKHFFYLVILVQSY